MSDNETIYPWSFPTFIPTIDRNTTEPDSSSVGTEIGVWVAVAALGTCITGAAVYFRKEICLKVISSYISTQSEGILFNLCSSQVDDYNKRQENIGKLRELAKNAAAPRV